MPHLTRFAIGVTGWESSESICRDLLSSDMETGSLQYLHLAGTPKNHPYFNAVRFISRVCRPAAQIYMCSGRIEGSLGAEYGVRVKMSEETAFLEYLHRQPSCGRHHLATVDFDDLEITTLQDVLDLRYNTDGRPLRRRLYKADQWASGSDTIIDQALRGCEALVGRLVEYRDAVKAFQISDAGDDREATIKAGRLLRQDVQSIRRAQEKISMVVDQGLEAELEVYLASLANLQAMQGA